MDKIQRFKVPDPGASSLTFTVPNGTTGYWKLDSITAVLTTDATAATRLWAVRVNDGEGNLISTWTNFQTQTQSQALTTSWQRGMNIQGPSSTGASGSIHMCAPDITLEEGDSITIFEIAGAAAGDRVTNCMITLRPVEPL